MIIHNNAELIDKFQWDLLVKSNPNGTIFQSPEIYDIYSFNNNYLPTVLAIIDDKSNKLTGVIVSVIQKEQKGILGIFSSRSIIIGGPLISNNNIEILNLLIKKNANQIGNNVIFSQFRNLFNLDGYNRYFEQNDYVRENHLNILIDLDKSIEDLWKGVHSKRRNEIRKAEKCGVTVRLIDNIDELFITYDILKEIYYRARLPLPEYDFFKKVWEKYNKEIFKIFIAIFEDKIIGTMYTLCYNNRIYDWYAGSYSAHYDKNPNDIIPWSVFLWGKENDFQIFDFGGAGNPNVKYGVRDYKKKFGGEIVDYGRYTKIHNQILFQFSKFGFKIWQLLKSK